MYVLMEKISRDAMRVDVPDVNPAGIDGTYIVKVRSSAVLRHRRYGTAGFASAELDREESTERGLTDRRKWHGIGHLYGAGAGKCLLSFVRAGCLWAR